MKTFNVHTHQIVDSALINGYLHGFIATKLSRSLGVHPWYIPEDYKVVLKQFEQEVERGENVLAIGECGLDKVCETPWTLQKEVFVDQITLAVNYQLPLIIHCVRAYQECADLLKNLNVPVVFHGFNRNQKILSQLMKNEYFYVSLGEGVFHENLRNTVLACPLERLFLETDDSNVQLEDVYEKVAAIKGLSLLKLKDQILQNRKTVFGI